MSTQAPGIERKRISNVAYLIILRGELKGWDALAVEEELSDVLDRGALEIVVDLSEVILLDSHAFDALVQTATSLRSLGGELLLACSLPRGGGYAFQPLRPKNLEPLRRLHPALDDTIGRLAPSRGIRHEYAAQTTAG